MDNSKKGIGGRLATARKAAALTQRELAEKLDVSEQAVAFMEQGRTGPSRDNVVALATILRVTTDYLLGLDPDLGELAEPSSQATVADIKRLEAKIDLMLGLLQKGLERQQMNSRKQSRVSEGLADVVSRHAGETTAPSPRADREPGAPDTGNAECGVG